MSGDAKLNGDFIIMAVLSAIVAAISLVSDGVAAVMGAMVIAPLLGPILGFAMGAALGAVDLLRRGIVTLLAGITIALFVSLMLTLFLPPDWDSRELMSRAEARLDGLALAMAAGGAAALSLTRGASSARVGVMVAAALLPPGAAIGLFAGYGESTLALRAALLLSLNIAALVLSALIVFRLRKIRPRTWIEQKHAQRAVWLNAGLSALFLAAEGRAHTDARSRKGRIDRQLGGTDGEERTENQSDGDHAEGLYRGDGRRPAQGGRRVAVALDDKRDRPQAEDVGAKHHWLRPVCLHL
ncbi:MAG: TIGR00341 family protein [Hyphomonas sp.]|uniref:TIGR00341 family protein n=1 Tax=Hyphomonas sp. TaxID=87 RepID=UPI0034A0289D